MQQKLLDLQDAALKEIREVCSMDEVENLIVKYLGKKGELKSILKEMGKLSEEERPVIGKVGNEVRDVIEDSLATKKDELKEIVKKEKLSKEVIDVTLPGKNMQ